MTNVLRPPRGNLDGVEVRGEVLAGTVDAMGSYRARALVILERLGVTSVRAGQWYPLAALLTTFEKIEDAAGARAMRRVGATVASTAVWPDGIDSLEAALSSIDVAYHMNHRRNGRELFDGATGQIVEGGIGHDVFLPAKPGERTALYICGSFYPDQFDLGMAEVLANKFKPAGADKVTVEIDASKPIRASGGATTTYVIRW